MPLNHHIDLLSFTFNILLTTNNHQLTTNHQPPLRPPSNHPSGSRHLSGPASDICSARDVPRERKSWSPPPAMVHSTDLHSLGSLEREVMSVATALVQCYPPKRKWGIRRCDDSADETMEAGDCLNVTGRLASFITKSAKKE